MSTQRQRLIYSVIAALSSLVLSMGFAVYYTTGQNQKWCETLAALTQHDPRTLPAPSTDAGRADLPNRIHTYDTLVRVRKGFHC
jgi:hypothetical protein